MNYTMRSKLIVSGCSYTYGAQKKRNGTIPWPDQLANLLDMELINVSHNGCGNNYILSSLTDAIYDNDPKDIGLVIAMWSEYDRIDFPISEGSFRFYEKKQKDGTIEFERVEGYEHENNKKRWTGININVVHGEKEKEHMILNGHSPYGASSWANFQNSFTRYCNENNFWSKSDCWHQSLHKFLHFKNLTNKKGLPYLQCVGPNPWVRGEPNDSARRLKINYLAKNLISHPFFDELDEPNFIGFPLFTNIGGYAFDDLLPIESGSEPEITGLTVGKYDRSYRISQTDSHPNTKGHKLFADHLYENYKNIY